ncbi:SH3 domain-containing protein [Olleya sp. HaHaR_3_96]|uniref:SH3 domain-containing protein n=1 Tax=Olleya sp. HaHaR_3_96 TaxID=2745560 RepID=UPI001C4E86D1|nr:SH3 domain-containing protein [Olleya sp. HaHaR_3_96]QXP61567.1 SH3 domain-containing protein [Olleya sp. HaHaR_3_96]
MTTPLKTLIIICVTLFCTLCFAQRSYTVKAKSGLIIRERPTINSERLGKLPYDYHFEVDEKKVNRLDTISTLVGHWVMVENDTLKGYVFDGFMKRAYGTEHYNLYGPVKSLKRYSYYENNKEKIKYDKHITFNKLGKKTQVYDYDDDAWVLDEEYTYNNKNQLVLRYQYNRFYETKYDQKGNEIESINSDKNKVPDTKFLTTYDSQGNTMSSEYYEYKKESSTKSIYTYNHANKKTKATHYNADGKLNSTYLYDYLKDTILVKKYKIDSENNKRVVAERLVNDSLGFITEKYVEYFPKETQYNKGKLYTYNQKVYDKQQQLIETTTYEAAESQFPNIGFSGTGGNYNERTVKRYQNGALTSTKNYRDLYYNQKDQEVLIEAINYKQNYSNELYHSYYSDSKESYRNEYYYDYNGRLIKHVEYRDDFKTIRSTKEYVYVFDNNGNWTVKNIFKNGKLYQVYKQALEYY